MYATSINQLEAEILVSREQSLRLQAKTVGAHRVLTWPLSATWRTSRPTGIGDSKTNLQDAESYIVSNARWDALI